ncbi:LLM class flavin-dependent oxidoreductase [Sphingomonas crocodyli]|uniref:LLM class flavin-dependent oxidoreductase n=1 Tax=Sphingomonas crocodyli TaxID=1979270 RepID=UPI0013E37C0F|nr:LLM class flavin-dependent oxidoreductase [Sphingomonas crocodyli]
MPRIMNFDLRHPPEFGVSGADIYAGALDCLQWADEQGFAHTGVGEHHQNDDGFSSCPLIFAAAVGARTKVIRFQTNVVLAPLYEPLRLAEEVAVADLCLNGRLILGMGIGTQPADFQAFGADFTKRGKTMDALIPFLRTAWSGEPFDYRGTTVRLRPLPVQSHVPINLGGVTPAAIDRAARLADSFQSATVAHWELYREACQRHGKPDPGPRARRGPMFLWVTKDDKAKVEAELMPHIDHVNRTYVEQTNQIRDDGGKAPSEGGAIFRGPYVREAGKPEPYLILNPEEAIALIDDLGPDGELLFNPLLAGIAPAKALNMLKLVEEEVFPFVRPN